MATSRSVTSRQYGGAPRGSTRWTEESRRVIEAELFMSKPDLIAAELLLPAAEGTGCLAADIIASIVL